MMDIDYIPFVVNDVVFSEFDENLEYSFDSLDHLVAVTFNHQVGVVGIDFTLVQLA